MIKVNGREIGTNIFPNNERIIEHISNYISANFSTYTEVEFIYQTDMDILTLQYVKMAIDESALKDRPCYLLMRYIPYSRMDRPMKDYSFTLKYFCRIINKLNFTNVWVLDAHSATSLGLLDRVVSLDDVLVSLIDDAISYSKPDVIMFPDAGAQKRYFALNQGLFSGYDVVFGDKSRNLKTGEITSFQVITNGVDVSDKKVLIIDDLCSRGGTFIGSANALKELGAKSVDLYVTHCENTIFRGKLLSDNSPISRVLTTDSILQDFSHKKLKRLQ